MGCRRGASCPTAGQVSGLSILGLLPVTRVSTPHRCIHARTHAALGECTELAGTTLTGLDQSTEHHHCYMCETRDSKRWLFWPPKGGPNPGQPPHHRVCATCNASLHNGNLDKEEHRVSRCGLDYHTARTAHAVQMGAKVSRILLHVLRAMKSWCKSHALSCRKA